MGAKNSSATCGDVEFEVIGHLSVLCLNVMKTVIAVLILISCAVANADPVQTARKGDAASTSIETRSSTLARPVVHLGMTAAEITKLIGRPDKVESIDTPVGKGENWLFRRLAKEWTQETAASMRMEPAFVGLGISNDGIRDVARPAFDLERVSIYQVSSLLLVDGRLVAAKQWSEKERRFQN